METLRDKGGEELDISPDKYTFNTVIHAYAKSGAKESAAKAHRILDNMNQMYREGNSSVKPDTITVSHGRGDYFWNCAGVDQKKEICYMKWVNFM